MDGDRVLDNPGSFLPIVFVSVSFPFLNKLDDVSAVPFADEDMIVGFFPDPIRQLLFQAVMEKSVIDPPGPVLKSPGHHTHG